MTTPRLRPELHATPLEQDGVRFFDVSDPRSGNKMRLYDFEWLLVAQMDGHRSLEEIARWAEAELHLQVSASNLSSYATTLGDLGFFTDGVPSAAASSPPATSTLNSAVTPLPPPRPGSDDLDEDISLDLNDDASSDAVTMQQDALPPATPSVSFDEHTEITGMALPADAPSVVPSNEARAGSQLDTTRPSIPLPAPLPMELPHDEGKTAVPPKKSSAGSILGLLFLLLLVGGVVAYFTWFAPQSAKVQVEPAKATDVLTLYDGVTKVGDVPPQKLSFEEAGKVTDIAATGVELKAGTPLVTLDGYPKVEKDLADVKDRLGYYQKQLDTAAQKGDVAGQKTAQEKVDEKKKLLGDLEAHATKLRITAVGPVVVQKIVPAVGADVKAGDPAVEIVDKRSLALFHTAAAALKVGDAATLKSSAGVVAEGKVVAHDGDAITIELPDNAPIKNGTEVRLAKSKLAGVIVVPASAVVTKDTGDTAFVLADGQVHAHAVKLSDRNATEAYVTSGLAPGDQVVITGGATLNDGDKAVVQQ